MADRVVWVYSQRGPRTALSSRGFVVSGCSGAVDGCAANVAGDRAFGQSPRFVSHGCKSRWGDQRGPGAAFETLFDFVSHGRLGIGIGQRGRRLTFDVFGLVSHGLLFSVVASFIGTISFLLLRLPWAGALRCPKPPSATIPSSATRVSDFCFFVFPSLCSHHHGLRLCCS